MGSTLPDLSSLLSSVRDANDTVRWSSAEDLARLSIDRMATVDDIGRARRSNGHLRLTGEGVSGHTAAMDDVGLLMTRWQKLVTSIGGAHRGFRGLRGRMSADVVRSTRLLLTSGSLPGSVMLDFSPQLSPGDELHPDGNVPALGDTEPLVDVAVGESLSILSAAVDLGPDADGSTFLETLSTLGPRAASALTEMAKSVSDGSFDLEVEWREPNRPTRRTQFGSEDARRLQALVASRKLDSEPETLTGEIHTITDISTIHLALDSGEMVPIKPGKITHDDLRLIAHGDRVRISVDVKMTQRPGEDPSPTYTATAISPA